MFTSLNRVAKTLSLFAVIASSAFAATKIKTNPQVSVHPQPRIVEAVDITKTTTLAGTHPASVSGLTDLGRVPASTQFNHMLLVLKSSDAQEYALHTLLDQQQDKSQGNYHQWMTPASFGSAFGADSSDISQVTGWLQQSGFTVNSVDNSGRVIVFSGTSGAVESAFHTEMHQYQVNGQVRVSNATDVSIPEALAPVVAGPATLNNFNLKSHAVNPHKVVLGRNGKPISETSLGGTPLTSDGQGDNFVGAADLQVLYNTTPLYAQGIDGAGQTIAIMGQTDILPADVQIYRSIFGLPPNPPVRIQVGSDPGTNPDDIESDLDVEMAGALAYNATVDFVTDGISYFGAGIESSMEYVVNNNVADIISLSYGECESDLGASGNLFFDEIWEQAASQGQTAFVSTGDSGADTCADGETTATSTGYSVNGLGSTPFNVSVGGTEFNETLDTSGATFWGPGGDAVPYENALSYIPEVPWNQSQYGDNTEPGLTAASSGISFYYDTPSWQTGPGVPATDPAPPEGSIPANSYKISGTHHRYMPDVALNASDDHDGTIFCWEGGCTINPDGTLGGFYVVGGTSVAAPTMASVQALINEKNGGRQGNANYYYYRVAAAQSVTGCDSNTYITTETSTCGFHDVVTGNTDTPDSRTVTATSYVGWNAAPSYDLAVGLGSPDTTQLATAWSTVTFNATTTSLTISPTTSAHGATYNVSITVAPVSSTSSIPTGNVSIVAEAQTGGGLGYYTLSGTSGTITGTLTGLPGGTYNVYAHYTGDTTFGGSDSAPVQVTVGTEAPIVKTASYLLGTNGSFTAASTFTYGTNIYLQTGVNPTTGVGIPTGSVTYTLKNTTTSTTLTPYTTNLDPYGAEIGTTVYAAGADLLAGNGIAADYIYPNYPVLMPGTYTATTAYSGDNTFTALTPTPITFVVSLAATALTVTPSTTEVASGGTAIIQASVATVGATDGGAAPTGTVTFTDSTTNTALGVATLTALPGGASSATSIQTKLLTTAGTHTITAVYSGDSNYATATKTASITVGGSSSAILLTSSATAAQVLTPITLTAAVPSGDSGTVYFFDGATPIGSARISTSTYTAALSVGTFAAGTHSITATYGGSSTYDSATSSATTIVISKNTPSVQLSVENNNTHVTSVNTAMNATLNLYPANVSASTGEAFAAVPAPTGAIAFTDSINGATAVTIGSVPTVYQPGGLGTYISSFVATAGLAPGYHVLSATYPGDANYAAATSNTDSIGIGITTTTLAISSSGSGSGISITIAATVAPVVTPQTPALTGTVSFYKGAVSTANLLGTEPVSGGVATITIPYSTTQETVTAVYSGDSNYYTSQSATTTIAGYVISVSPATITMSAKGIATVTVTATSFGGYAGIGSLSCSGLPANTFCPYNDVQQFTFNGVDGSQSYSFTITADNAQGAGSPVHAGLIWLPAILLAGLLAFGRKRLTVRGRQLMVLAILFCGMMAVSGCGGGNDYSNYTTPTGTYTVTLTSNGTGANASSPNLTTSTTLTLQVQ